MATVGARNLVTQQKGGGGGARPPAARGEGVWVFFWPLQIGARLVVAKPDGHRDPAFLAEIITAEGVTVTHFV
ncbi:hypothetical protein, partial [Nocardia cyriacigeorgica]|uniref:hypothetical protein n=1 Tax=Nocardia cyriacigeorgica TaxID=135487 RepID=UPI002457B032